MSYAALPLPDDLSSIRAVIFDYAGVMTVTLNMPGNNESTVTTSPNYAEIDDPLQRVRAFMRFELRNPDPTGVWNRLERGETKITEFFHSMSVATGSDVSQFQAGMGEVMSRLTVRDDMVSRVAALKANGFKTALLTNNVAEWRPMWTALLDEAGAMPHFDVVVDSSEVGMRKPEARIYHHAVSALGIEASEALFLDDFDLNVEGARAAGLFALQVTPDDSHLGVLDALTRTFGT